VNCGAIPEGLIESELFGHTKGRIQPARRVRKQGLFQGRAGWDALPRRDRRSCRSAFKFKLLRAIQERSIRPVGDNSTSTSTSAWWRPPIETWLGRSARGASARTSYYRLNVVEIRVPALRERREDVLPLADHFLRRFAAEHSRPVPRLSADAESAGFSEYWFPGNVRELENLIRARRRPLHRRRSDGGRAAGRASRVRSPRASPGGPLPAGFALEEYLAQIERELIDRALTESEA